MTNDTLPQSIFFGSLLVAGSSIYAAVAAFGLDWFVPSVIMIVAGAIGWNRFMEGQSQDSGPKTVEKGLMAQSSSPAEDLGAYTYAATDTLTEALEAQSQARIDIDAMISSEVQDDSPRQGTTLFSRMAKTGKFSGTEIGNTMRAGRPSTSKGIKK